MLTMKRLVLRKSLIRCDATLGRELTLAVASVHFPIRVLLFDITKPLFVNVSTRCIHRCVPAAASASCVAIFLAARDGLEPGACCARAIKGTRRQIHYRGYRRNIIPNELLTWPFFNFFQPTFFFFSSFKLKLKCFINFIMFSIEYFD